MRIRWLFRVMAAGMISVSGPTGIAQATERHLGSEEVRILVAEGVVLSLESLLDRHADVLDGRLLDVEIEREREHGTERYRYEIEMLGSDGIVREFKFDATSGRMIEMEIED